MLNIIMLFGYDKKLSKKYETDKHFPAASLPEFLY